MHLGDNVDHRRQRGVVGMNHHIDPVAENVQLTIGDQDGDLDQLVRAQVEPGHLAVDPHQFVAHRAHSKQTLLHALHGGHRCQ